MFSCFMLHLSPKLNQVLAKPIFSNQIPGKGAHDAHDGNKLTGELVTV